MCDKPFTPEAAIERWYGDCLGQPKELEGSPLAYEPRSAWGCESCGAVLVGTKSGHLYLITRDQVRAIEHWPGVSIQAIHGCANAEGHRENRGGATPGAIVGTSDGHLWFKAHDGAPEQRFWLDDDRQPPPGVVAARLVQDSRRNLWCLAATTARTIELQPLHDGGHPARLMLPRNVRAVLALTRLVRRRRSLPTSVGNAVGSWSRQTDICPPRS